MQGYDAETGIYYPVEQRGWIDSALQIIAPLACEVFSTDCDGPAPPPPPPEENSFNWRPILVVFGIVVVIVTVVLVVIKISKK